jgi:hypothetical protein
MVCCRLLQKRVLCWPTLTNICASLGLGFWRSWFRGQNPIISYDSCFISPWKNVMFPLFFHQKLWFSNWFTHETVIFFPTDFPWTTRRWEFWTAQSPTSPFTELSQQLLPQAGCIHLWIHTVHIYYIYNYIYMYNVSNQSHDMYMCSYDSIIIYIQRERTSYIVSFRYIPIYIYIIYIYILYIYYIYYTYIIYIYHIWHIFRYLPRFTPTFLYPPSCRSVGVSWRAASSKAPSLPGHRGTFNSISIIYRTYYIIVPGELVVISCYIIMSYPTIETYCN